MMDILEYVMQGKIWFSADDGALEVSKMSADHKRLSARWLHDNATAVALVCECRLNTLIKTGDASITDVLRLMARPSREWIKTTPLYLALTAGAGR